MKENPFLNPDPKREKYIQYLFDQINEWYFDTGNSNFDPGFFESIETFWTEKNYLTDKQFTALERIYQTWVDT